MEKKRDELLNSSILTLFIKYFIPTFIGSIVVVLYNIVDRFFVGKISEKALAGAGVSFYIVMILIAFSMLIGVGSGTIVSIRLGQGKEDEAEKILGNAVTVFGILGLVLFILLRINLDTILLYSGANSETLSGNNIVCDISVVFLLRAHKYTECCGNTKNSHVFDDPGSYYKYYS